MSVFAALSAAPAPCSSGVAPTLVATVINVRSEELGSRRLSPSRVTIDIAMDPARTSPSLT